MNGIINALFVNTPRLSTLYECIIRCINTVTWQTHKQRLDNSIDSINQRCKTGGPPATDYELSIGISYVIYRPTNPQAKSLRSLLGTGQCSDEKRLEWTWCLKKEAIHPSESLCTLTSLHDATAQKTSRYQSAHELDGRERSVGHSLKCVFGGTARSCTECLRSTNFWRRNRSMQIQIFLTVVINP
jgi:hypothetical protein